jgi:dTDP-4-dehydrorhamnose 3,5-epimerase-like enzyme
MKQNTGLTGASFNKCSIFNNPLGDLRHVLINNNDYLKISEIYFSEISPKSIKGWKFHNFQTQNISVAFGKVRIICVKDDNDDQIFEIFDIDSKSNHGVLSIPPGIHYALINLYDNVAILCNATDKVHDPNEYYSTPPDSEKFIDLINKYNMN